MKKVKLFCLPYAGGSAVIYSKWKKLIHPSIEIKEVELAGRGRRMIEPLIDNMEETVEDIFHIIKEQISGPYALFGHSMGGLITYELCHKLKKEGYPDPAHVFISGRKGPQVKFREHTIHDLPDEDFIFEILKYDGMDRSVFDNKELANIFIPILRADFKMIETYVYRTPSELLNYHLSIFHGINDKAVQWNELLHWKEVTRKESEIFTFPGGHFFINEHSEQVINQINKTLTYHLKDSERKIVAPEEPIFS